MESSKSTSKCVCRVCDENGHYDLCEMKFRCNDSDILLIDAFNAFSTLNNDSSEIYLCKVCTDSLTLAYSFWQQIKRSDEKLINQSKHNLLIEQHQKCFEINDLQYTVESVNQSQSDKSNDSEEVETITEEPITKKFRKRKSNVSAITTAANIAIKSEPSYDVRIGSNIAFPHFIIANIDREPNTSDENVANGEIYCEDGSGCGGANAHTKMQRKQIKTIKPSAIIPSDLNKINALLSEPLLGNDMDTKSTIFKCSHCPKAYAAPHHLMVHMRKSHLCQYCLSTFAKINDLYSHVKEMHQTFPCLFCGKEFQSNGNLRQHMRKHHSIFLPAHISLLNVSNGNESDMR